jgi:tRNA(Ile)-lysidine synthase
VPKTRLEATLIVRGLSWRQDPSNEDQFFERVRVRKAVQNLKYMGVTTEALARTADRARAAREALDYATACFSASLNVSFNDEIFASFDRAPFDKGPSLLRQRVLAPLIARYGGDTPRPELKELERLSDRLAATMKSTHTLGGVVVSAGQRTIRLWREAGRVSTKPLRLAPGTHGLWDGRFIVAASRQCECEVSVSALGETDYRALAESGLDLPSCPARAAYALPAFRAGGLVLAVPQLKFAGTSDEPPVTGCATRLTSVPAAGT